MSPSITIYFPSPSSVSPSPFLSSNDHTVFYEVWGEGLFNIFTFFTQPPPTLSLTAASLLSVSMSLFLFEMGFFSSLYTLRKLGTQRLPPASSAQVGGLGGGVALVKFLLPSSCIQTGLFGGHLRRLPPAVDLPPYNNSHPSHTIYPYVPSKSNLIKRGSNHF